MEAYRENKKWNNLTIGITGASGSLGRALTKALKQEGAYVIGLTHRSKNFRISTNDEPQEWIQWNCGEESKLQNVLDKIDILIINHGINPKGDLSPESLDKTLEINAFSCWRLMKSFENITTKRINLSVKREIWINTSEAEVQPALSPGYEISKKLIGELVSIRWENTDQNTTDSLRIRKIVLGPFKSDLNPIGIMNSEFVAKQIIFQAKLNIGLIIVTPNPLTYITMPILEGIRSFYYYLIKSINK